MHLENIRFSAVRPSVKALSTRDYEFHAGSAVRNILTERQVPIVMYAARGYITTVHFPWRLRCEPTVFLERNDGFELAGMSQDGVHVCTLNDHHSPIIYAPEMVINALSEEETAFLALRLMIPLPAVTNYVSALLRMPEGYDILRSRGI